MEVSKLKLFSKTAVQEREIEEVLNERLEECREEMKRRVGKLKLPVLPANINPRVYALYRQVINSYLYGNYESACALARAIVEGIATSYIERMGMKDELTRGKKAAKSISTAGILKVKLNVSNELLRHYSRIVGKADEILHNIDKAATEKEALERIKSLNYYIRKFPRTL